MAKKTTKSPEKVEISIERVDHDANYFLVFNAKSNRPKYHSQIYTQRCTCLRGARRYVAANNMKVTRWLK